LYRKSCTWWYSSPSLQDESCEVSSRCKPYFEEFASNGTNEDYNRQPVAVAACLASLWWLFYAWSFSRVLRVNSFYRPVSEWMQTTSNFKAYLKWLDPSVCVHLIVLTNEHTVFGTSRFQIRCRGHGESFCVSSPCQSYATAWTSRWRSDTSTRFFWRIVSSTYQPSWIRR
jgi:hypothetical protein